jgi:branched-chain amino acid transport system substrate-binding protein
MKRIFLLCIALILVASTVLSGCGKATSSATYKIGFLSELTGADSVYGQSMRKGAELAVDEINAAGGVNGKQIEVIYEDDQSTPAEALMGFSKLVDTDKVPFIIGPCVSTNLLAYAPVAQQKSIPVISEAATAPALRKYAGTVFGMMPTDEAQGAAVASAATKLGAKKVVLLYINNDYGKGVMAPFVQAFTGNGGTITFQEALEPNKTDYRTELLKVKDQNPQYVVMFNYPVDGANILKEAKELGINAQWIGDSGLQDQDVINLAGEGAEGLIAIQQGQVEGQPAYDTYSKAFSAKYGTPPTLWSHYAYESVKIVADAIKANGYNSDSLKQYFLSIKDRPTPWGNLTVDKDGFALGVYSYYTVKNGQWVYTGNV